LEPAKAEAPTGPEQPVPVTEPTEEGGGLGTKGYIGIAAASVGAASMIAFAIFGSLTSSEYTRLQDLCPDNNCPPSQSSEADKGHTYQTVANVTLVVGAVGLAAGIGLIIWDVADGDDEAEGEEPPPESTTPTVAVGPGSIVVSGKF
jgi:hypothetical protein